jgi:drug/metabolite transporter (DMT)-like permease
MTSPTSSFWPPILLNFLAAILGAAGQALYQVGGLRLGQVPLWKNWALFLGMALFCVVMVLFVVAFKWGGKLSVTYPAYATTFIWGALIAHYFRGESISGTQVVGLTIIVLGVGLSVLGK